MQSLHGGVYVVCPVQRHTGWLSQTGWAPLTFLPGCIWSVFLLCVLNGGRASEPQSLLLSGTQLPDPSLLPPPTGGFSPNPICPREAGVSDQHNNTYIMNVEVGKGVRFLR